MNRTQLKLPWLALIACLGLGSAASAISGTPAMIMSAEVGPAVAAACSATVAQHPDEGDEHAVNCSQLAYGSNPPSSGTHYENWAAYKTYSDRVPPGFLVHSLEHGALVIGYNCQIECDDEVTLAQAWINSLPNDPVCPGKKHKIILAPNSALDMRWGAAAWGWTWKAPCMDTASLAAFFRAHYGKTVETGVCTDGEDLSSSGWCSSAVRRPGMASPGGFPGAGGLRTLWTGSLPRRSRILVEAALPDGSVLETLDLGEAGPGAAKTDWDEARFRMRFPSAGKMILRVRTSAGRQLAVQAVILSP